MQRFIFFILVNLIFSSLFSQSIQAIKIGESRNLFSHAYAPLPTITSLPKMGDGVIAVAYRQHADSCMGLGSRDHEIRYAISLNGGKSWDVGIDTVPPDVHGCYGKGPLNSPPLPRATRYPAINLFARNGVQHIDSLGLAYVNSGLAVSTVDAMAYSCVLDPHTSNPIIVDQGLFMEYGLEEQDASYGLTTQELPSGEQHFWVCPFFKQNSVWDPNFALIEGIYDPHVKGIDWQVKREIKLPGPTVLRTHYPSPPLISFDPSGQYGWIAIPCDLSRRQDGSLNPTFLRSVDYGRSWSEAFEVDLNEFAGVQKRITGAFKPLTLKESVALTVDADGKPHYMINISSIEQLSPLVYNDYHGLFDLTQSACSDEWKLIHLTDLKAERGILGDTAVFGDVAGIDNFFQISRTADGEKIFFSWIDSDMPAVGSFTNQTPDLQGMALDIRTSKMTPVINWTAQDTVWHGKALYPHVASMVLQDQDTFLVPTVVTRMEMKSAFSPVSLWYFPHISYTPQDFSQHIIYEAKRQDLAPQANIQLSSPNCGQANGALQVQAIGGASPYQYQWGANANFATSASLSNLAAGVYELTITDSLGFQETFDMVLNDANAAIVSIDSQATQQPICHGDSNGRLHAVTSLSSAQFLWSNGETTPTASRLPAGRHRVQITDTQGCTSYAVYRLAEPSPLDLTLESEGYSFYDENRGWAQATPSGGSGYPYRIHWSNGWTGQQVAGLAAGQHSCTLIDSWGCELQKSFQIDGPTQAIPISISTSDASNCRLGLFDGNAMAQTPPGGNAPYSYNWGDYGNGPFIFGLQGGLYQVRITDRDGFLHYDQAIIGNTADPFPKIYADIQPASCSTQHDGSVKLTLAGGSPPFSYEWAHGPTTPDLQNLAPGYYECAILQTNACNVIVSIWIPQSPSPTVQFAIRDDASNQIGPRSVIVEAVSRNGLPPYTYLWSTGDTSSLVQLQAPGQDSVIVTDAQACQATQVIKLRGSSTASFSSFPTEVIHDCDGQGSGEISLLLSRNPADYDIQWAHGPTSAHIQQLHAGTYYVSIYDSVGMCRRTQQFEIRSLAPFDLQAFVQPVSCKGGADGRIDLQVTGGNTAYRSLWDHGAEGDHLRDLAPGSYTVHVMESVGCSDSLTIQVEEPINKLEVAVSGEPDQAPGGEGKAFASASGGWPPYVYTWQTTPIQYGDTLKNLLGGVYRLKVRDSLGCVMQKEVIVDSWVGLDKTPSQAQISIFPNPNEGSFWLNVVNASALHIEINLFDLQGKKLLNQAYGQVKELSQKLELEGLPTSIYLLQIQVGEDVYWKKVMIGE